MHHGIALCVLLSSVGGLRIGPSHRAVQDMSPIGQSFTNSPVLKRIVGEELALRTPLTIVGRAPSGTPRQGRSQNRFLQPQ